MKKKNFLPFLLLLTGCGQHGDLEPPQIHNCEIQSFSDITKDIYIDVLTDHFGGYNEQKLKTRAQDAFTITPYIEQGDTLMYIVQYEKGWDLYSASISTSKIIFSSKEGSFDINDPNMPDAMRALIHLNCEVVKEAKHNGITYVNPSWNEEVSKVNLNQGTAKVKKNGVEQLVSVSDLPPGYWKLVETELISNTTYYSPRLIKTFWHQNSPWNQYSKYVKNDKGVYMLGDVGCGVIGVAQYLYYTHYKDNVPVSTVTTALPTSDGLDFTFSGNSSSVWDKMPTSTYFTTIAEPASIFIGYTGRELKANYESGGTGVSPSNYLQYLNKIYGTVFTSSSVDLYYIMNSIDKGYPVISQAESNKYADGTPKQQSGHMFIIDGYEKNTKEYLRSYVYVREGSSGEDPYPWEDDDRDADGNFIDYTITKQEKDYSITYSIYMNWGWGNDKSNNVAYLPLSSQWIAGDSNYNLNHFILKRSDVQ